MSETVYVLTGDEGSYSDWHMWLIAGFPTREEAVKWQKILEAIRDSARAKYVDPDFSCDEEDAFTAWVKPLIPTPFTLETFGVRDHYEIYDLRDAKFSVVELPWNTSLAGGIPK